MLNTHTAKGWFKTILLIFVFGIILGVISKQLFNPKTSLTYMVKAHTIKATNTGDSKYGQPYRVRSQ